MASNRFVSATEARNPFYILLMVASLLFVGTALAYGVLPVLEQQARDAGQATPPSDFRTALNEDGWKWLLYELAAMMVFGLSSMVLDRLRTLKQRRSGQTIPGGDDEYLSTND